MPYQRSSVHSNGYSTDGQQSRSGEGDAPTYVIEHLATFTVSKEAGVVYPADGMRRLLQLEKSNGIWSQKMQLRLDQNWVLIMDYETGSVMERFPAVLIQEPTAFTSHDPMEIYNNILVFIVGEHQSGARSEMHIFQCQFVSAQELAEDLKLLRSGKAPVNRRSRHIPPPPPTPPPEPPLNGVNVREQVSVFNAAAHHGDPRGGEMVGRRAELYSASGPNPGRDAASLSLNDETSSTSSEKYERDVTILNHCFDDIEKFIARLQHAAAASRELERRKRNRKSKKKDMGDGMLSMRAKPPPEGEFVDIFQKFKLSFNLLAKLKAHIHDPNAPELVHFLFTPLALIVDASHDTPYGPNLPAKVVSPLLTREAVNLLINCVTSKETELWHSLGDAWLVPRDQWKGYVAPYHPVFMDGWSPEFPLIDEREQPAEGKRNRNEEIRAAQQDTDYASDYFDYELQEGEQARFAYENRNFVPRGERYREEREHSQSPVSSDRDYPSGPPLPLRDVTARSDISADSIERNGGPGHGVPLGPGGPMGPAGPIGPGASGSENQQRFERVQARWLQELKSKGAKVVQVTYPRTANNDKELTVIRGEYLEILDDSRKWWKARNVCGQVAHVPHTIVTTPTADSSDVFSNPLYIRNYDRMENPRDREAGSPPLSSPALQPADWVRERQGKKAHQAKSYLPEPPVRPPAPPPLPTQEQVQVRSPTRPLLKNVFSSQNSTSSIGSLSVAESSVLEELESVLKGVNKPQRSLEIHRTPEVYIDQQSDSKAVEEWLKAKGFSEGLCKKLQGTTGAQLLQLSRSDLGRTVGPDEDWRLYSQLTLQRNLAAKKFKTARTVELESLLQKFRQKAEEEGKNESKDKTSEATQTNGDAQTSSKTSGNQDVSDNLLKN